MMSCVRITAQVAIMSDLDYADLTEEIHPHGLKRSCSSYQGRPCRQAAWFPSSSELRKRSSNRSFSSFAYAFIIIAVVMMIVPQRLRRRAVFTMLPNLWPVGVVFGSHFLERSRCRHRHDDHRVSRVGNCRGWHAASLNLVPGRDRGR